MELTGAVGRGPPAILQCSLVPKLAPIGAALLLLLQHRCSLDRSLPAPSARRGWGATQPVMGCVVVGEGHGTKLRRGRGAVGGEGGAAWRMDEQPGTHRDGHMRGVGNFSFFFSRG
jgi:hypothetical protein